MVKESGKHICEYTYGRECSLYAVGYPAMETVVKAVFCDGTPCDYCIARNAYEKGRRDEVEYRINQEEEKGKAELDSLRNELKRTDLTEGERAKVLKRITDYIRSNK